MARQLVEMESLFKALADATRLRILGLLLSMGTHIEHRAA
jgi:DNA-binding transcriptional ArsR family regulator